MACNALQDWTISSLIAIFFKLVKAFILIWVASVVFFIAKFLSFFGLHLPCSCNDIIQDQNSIDSNVCVQRVFIEWPFRMISSTESHILSKFPFKWSCTIEKSGSSSQRNANLIDAPPVDGSCDKLLRTPQMVKDCLSYCNSLGPQDAQMIDPAACSEIQYMQTEITATKSGFGTHAPDESEGHACQKQKVDQKSSQDSNAAPSGLHGDENMTIVGECNSSLLATSVGYNQLDIELPGVTDLFTEDTLDKVLPSNNCYQLEKTSSLPELEVPYRINDLRKQLREEREARKALSLELDQERNAAQTAAEETLAMISRIQSEKASAEMEARQFKRIVEEKSVYDEEAIEILKEIVVKLERERLDLKDEVEMYRRSLLKDRSEKWERGSYADSNEDNSSVHDVHVVQTPTKRDLDRNMMSPLSLTPDRYQSSCLLQGIAENGLENKTLRDDNSAGISPGYEYENLEARDRKTSNAGLYLNSRSLYANGLEGIQSHDLRTKSMIRRDMARMKAEDEIEHLSEKLLALFASRESAISSMQYLDKETFQKNILEDIAQSLRDIHRLREGGECVVQESLPSESGKKSFLAIYSTF
ncbi:myosin-binding protein 2 isoform X1 [Cryptomeria japonica]|uniref:myosin-binding protein 2 isoform X1 n=1 Tax=Cryptomeria japonica TaxID=3369 RepID=UPI0027DA35D5|nr:myosin-binding protein 2 isoform X1 [Cryptomeria japonica]XP_057866220.2 myosin-binding protein 2 isoform X1 [Cryptomeria japonica]